MKTYISVLLVVSLGLISTTPIENERRLIKTSETDPGRWLTEAEIWKLIEQKANFVDVTNRQHLKGPMKPNEAAVKAIPSSLKYQTEVRQIISAIDSDRIESFISEFSTFHTRYYTSTTGVQSQQWLLAQVNDAVRNYQGSATVQEFEHSWPQNSVIARIEGSDPLLKSEVVILGAHQDSLNLQGSSLRSPGADDNAAGSVVVLETLRAIVDSGFIPKRTLEFQWYAAEEVGLLGSEAIASNYQSTGVNVVGMVNFDVPGYQPAGADYIGIYTDNGHSDMYQFLRLLTDEYLEYGRRDRTCGYGCSDHYSFTEYGFPAAMPAEFTFHPQMHSTGDTLENLSLPQVREFVKLGLGVMVEFGEPSN